MINPTRLILYNNLKFWSQNSYEHIDVLLNLYEPYKAILYPKFKKKMNKLFESFKKIYNNLIENIPLPQLTIISNNYLKTNNDFINILRRLKFEGYNGFPILYQITYHILYEQLYVNEIFNNSIPTKNYSNSTVIFTKFKPFAFDNPINMIYNQMYFWSIIGAEHPSILMNITPTEMMNLPKATIEKFTMFTNKFNNINYKLSNVYSNLTPRSLYKIYIEFKQINSAFIKFLVEFKESNNYLSQKLKQTLPKLFFGIWQHIFDEHKYVEKLCKYFENIFKNINIRNNTSVTSKNTYLM